MTWAEGVNNIIEQLATQPVLTSLILYNLISNNNIRQ
jgi:hypothetical protein